MGEVAKFTGGIVDEIAAVVAAIDSAELAEAKAAHDRMGMAREWAKLQENAAELAERLVWLEAVILRRIGQLDATVLPGARRAAARHFATLDDASLSALLHDYPARSAIAAYNLWAKAEGIRRAHARGKRMVLNRYRNTEVGEISDLALADVVRERIATVQQAAAIIVDEYGQVPRTVSQVVDDFIDEWSPVREDASPLEVTAFRRGLSDAVRTAFATAPIETTDRSWEIPAYLTIFVEESAEWRRVPSEYATVTDARQALALRRGQAEAAARAVEKFEEVLERRFGLSTRDGDEWLRGDVTALTRRQRYLDELNGSAS